MGGQLGLQRFARTEIHRAQYRKAQIEKKRKARARASSRALALLACQDRWTNCAEYVKKLGKISEDVHQRSWNTINEKDYILLKDKMNYENL
jgi:hypothetical protein